MTQNIFIFVLVLSRNTSCAYAHTGCAYQNVKRKRKIRTEKCREISRSEKQTNKFSKPQADGMAWPRKKKVHTQFLCLSACELCAVVAAAAANTESKNKNEDENENRNDDNINVATTVKLKWHQHREMNENATTG